MAPLDPNAPDGGPRVGGDRDLYRALLERAGHVYRSLVAQGAEGMEIRLSSLSPFVTGIGQPHPLENGFAFLKPYGVPYLAGSGVKGAVRAACTQAWREKLGDVECKALLLHYFGSDDKDPPRGVEARRLRGTLTFLDLWPQVQGWDDVFRLDIVNPHYGPYYQGKDVPADWHSPVPSFFLTLRHGLRWCLRILYCPVDRSEPPRDWGTEIMPGVRAALTTEGLGAKKSWGYGLFTIEAEEFHGPPRTPTADAPTAHEKQAAETGLAPQAPQPASPAPEPPLTPGAQSLMLRIRTMRDTEVSRMPTFAQDIARCSPEEQPVLVAALRHRLGELDVSGKSVRDWIKRFSILRLPEEA